MTLTFWFFFLNIILVAGERALNQIHWGNAILWNSSLICYYCSLERVIHSVAFRNPILSDGGYASLTDCVRIFQNSMISQKKLSTVINWTSIRRSAGFTFIIGGKIADQISTAMAVRQFSTKDENVIRWCPETSKMFLNKSISSVAPNNIWVCLFFGILYSLYIWLFNMQFWYI